MRVKAALILLTVAACSARAQFSYSTNNNGTLTVTGYGGSSETADVPASAYGRTVTGVAYLAFAESEVQSVSIPGTVDTIDPEAFLFCTQLSQFTVNATNAVFGSTNGALCNRSLTYLADFPGGVSGSYTIPSSVKQIGPYAFAGSTLNEVIIPTSVTNISQQAFWSCGNLGNIEVPGSVKGFSAYAFWNCLNLTNATLESGITNIPNNAFYQCVGLATVEIPNTVTTISSYAFGDCSSLPQVTIPASVTNIQSEAFLDCEGLTNVFFLGNAPAVGSSIFGSDTNATAYYLAGATGWSNFVSLRKALWNPVIQVNDGNFGEQNGGFGFDVTGPTNVPIAVEAANSLTAPVWRLITNTSLAGGKIFVQDDAWTNSGSRFYRVTTPK